MKNTGLVITIIIVILLIHGAIFGSCVYLSNTDTGKKPAAAAKQSAEKTEGASALPEEKGENLPPPEKTALPQSADVQTPVPAKTAVPQTPVPPPVPSLQTPPALPQVLTTRADLPFDYRYAVNGNIGALPASALSASGILVDLTTRKVLWQKNAKKGFPIASMTKVMTLLIAYEDVLAHRNGLTLDTPVRVSREAMKMGGSQVYLDVKETFPMRDLMIATSIQSANDAAYLIAEYVGGGDVASFVERMNTKAKELGMPDTEFFNPHGLPGTRASLDNRASPEGMAKLAEASLRYPQLVAWASTRSAMFRGNSPRRINMINHNHLLPGASEASAGVNGLKTGFTARAKYCVTITCVRNGRILVGVVTGMPGRRDRDRFMRSLMNWGYGRAADPQAALKKDAPYVAPKKKSVPAKNSKAPAKSSKKKKK